jgi:hypothetical protein
MIFRRQDNPFPFAKSHLAASSAPLTRGQRSMARYALTTVGRHLDQALHALRGSDMQRGGLATRVDVMIGDLQRVYDVLMAAEAADRADREKKDRAEMDRMTREWGGEL